MRWPWVSRRAYDVMHEDVQHMRELVLILIGEKVSRPNAPIAGSPAELLGEAPDPKARKVFGRKQG